ncbi:uncharacterized protein M421DRAFT_3082 [Didymella exigua CBS 183.55]|uniref:Uncharacterized protein n=1 Tax=Didymella exigua CBS 183.55 TaxID=1150837 RepID=A0A6A5RUZ2_9PLEO|nr:uncharacterized protein M421DRAFT_3082 [Didymella exigua CBS 183.55]KAF1930788.1 hypothetical protein M421DRAFT_3082 [Didymella exigua CBS 183.55]
MQSWMSWATFLAILAAGYFYYGPKLTGDTRGRSTANKTTTSSKAVDWEDSDSKPKAVAKQAKKQAKAKAPRKKSVQETVQEAGDKIKAEFDAATAGAPASDDSLSASPVRAAPKIPSGKDVSDMLPSAASVANVLNIKTSDKPTKTSKPRAQKVETPQETKKQRQNRQKKEAEKAQREEDENARQVLLEKQRRTAREARGEPAKNGVSAKLPSNNPWAGQSSGGAVQAPAASTGQLLDTFDGASTASSIATNGADNSPDTANGGNYNGLPSEEEQLRLAMEDDSAWTTIPKSGKKQKAAMVNEEAHTSGAAAVQAVKVAQAPQVKKTESRAPISSSRYGILSEPFTTTEKDSDWPVM